MVELVPNLPSRTRRSRSHRKRRDGRSQWESRHIELEVDCLYNADGSAKVTWGDTMVYAGVKFEIRQPWPDRPSEGSLMCGAASTDCRQKV